MNHLAASHINPYDLNEMADRLVALSLGDRRTAYGKSTQLKATSKPVARPQGILKLAPTKTKTVVRRRHK